MGIRKPAPQEEEIDYLTYHGVYYMDFDFYGASIIGCIDTDDLERFKLKIEHRNEHPESLQQSIHHPNNPISRRVEATTLDDLLNYAVYMNAIDIAGYLLERQLAVVEYRMFFTWLYERNGNMLQLLLKHCELDQNYIQRILVEYSDVSPSNLALVGGDGSLIETNNEELPPITIPTDGPADPSAPEEKGPGFRF